MKGEKQRMKKLLLTSMLCFCMLMQACTISESDTAEDKIVNIDGSIECSWGMSAEDIKSKEKAELTGEEEYFNTYSLGYNAGVLRHTKSKMTRKKPKIKTPLKGAL